jgi:type IV pilus assembly protein PilE
LLECNGYLEYEDSKNMKPNLGFTLIELMVTVAIIGILASVAYPSYIESVRKSNRADAKSTMMQVANQEERYYTENNVYGTITAIGNATNPVPSQSGKHNIAVVTANAGATYTITATPVQTDSTCGNLTITNTGATGNSVGAAAGVCW